MSRVIAVANQKGGVAKTTTVAALASALSERGRKVLAVDLDPQACLTFSLGLEPDDLEPTVHDVLVGRAGPREAVVEVPDDDFALLPANIDLAGAEAYLLTRTGREYALRGILGDLEDFDLVLLDCPPSLGVLTINALTAADEVVIPLQCETLSHRGVGQLLSSIEDVRRLTNRGLVVRGILPTMFDGRTNHAREVLADVGGRYGLPVLEPPIRKSIRFAEAPRDGRSIIRYAPSHPGADAYRELARQFDS
ncbi:MAG TPA: ParA family protein [Actinomycetota bacterium]|nr:ParA family protein [Actinomycetota bacterium]